MSAIFISHSSKDNEVARKIRDWLIGLGHKGIFLDIDPEDGIHTGADWEQEITAEMERARIAVLLISRNFLTSPFILREEVRRLLERRASEGVTVFPVIAKACA